MSYIYGSIEQLMKCISCVSNTLITLLEYHLLQNKENQQKFIRAGFFAEEIDICAVSIRRFFPQISRAKH